LSKIRVRFVGALSWASGREQTEVEIGKAARVRSLIEALVSEFSDLRSIIGDENSFDPRPSMVILVNDVEIGLLDGLETCVSDGDILTLIPIAHGG
jgi:molybdopterin converting factor small subunit